MPDILVLYYSRHGSIEHMANLAARGVESVDGCRARIRTVPDVSPLTEATADEIPASGPPYVDRTDLDECAGLLLGSPAYFGNIASPLKYFLEQTTAQWLSGSLVDKPAGVFTASSSFHGGQESTLVSMMLPLMHQGMIMVGLPFTEAELNTTQAGGTPYGASHISGQDGSRSFTSEEEALCVALGKRVARIARKLADHAA
jgi:NAD(P)H dehydrogenase (quinone)